MSEAHVTADGYTVTDYIVNPNLLLHPYDRTQLHREAQAIVDYWHSITGELCAIEGVIDRPNTSP